ncbi:MAG: AAA family ATPase [Acetobacteraceae bacterium]|nr:AAA family ATPase [Acetobacteraceae bacterium]
MGSIYLMGSPGSGKTALAAGLALKARELKLKVAYFKPVGASPGPARAEDEDAVLMKALLGMDLSPQDMVLHAPGPHYLSRCQQPGDYLEAVRERYARLAQGMDGVIVGGAPWPFAMAGLGLAAVDVARGLGSRVVIVQRIESDLSLDSVVMYSEWARGAGVPVLGAVFNHVPPTLMERCRGVFLPCLERRGIRVLGIIPLRAEISYPTVGEYYEVLGGELLTGAQGLDRVVEDILVGAMTQESVLQYFRRAPNKAVITGGDRTDVAMAALETSTSVLILTGGLYPNVRVVGRAQEKQVPVILVKEDTYTAIERLHLVSRKIRPSDTVGIETALKMVEEHCDWRTILDALRAPDGSLEGRPQDSRPPSPKQA